MPAPADDCRAPAAAVGARVHDWPAVAAAVAKRRVPAVVDGERPMEHGQRGHDHLRVLHAVAEALEDRPEAGPLLWDGVPALGHESVDRAGAVVGRLQPAAVRHQLHHLLVAAAGVRHVAEGHHLPEEDAERPGNKKELKHVEM